MDMVQYEDYKASQGPVWGSLSKSMSAELFAAMNEVGEASRSNMLSIDDPSEREPALQEYRVISGTAAAEKENAIAQASQAAFEYIEQGGSID